MSVLWMGLAAACLLVSGPARALRVDLAVDPNRSRIEISSVSEVELDPPIGPLTLPVSPPLGGPGAPQPDGSISDGLGTFLTGNVALDLTGSTVHFRWREGVLDPALSGSWLPGVPDPNLPSPADLGASLRGADFGVTAEMALRGGRFRLSSAPIPLRSTAQGFEFPTEILIHASSGYVVFNTNTPGVNGAAFLRNFPERNVSATASLEFPDGDRAVLTIPIETTLVVPLDPLAGTLTLVLRGQVVASGLVPGCGDLTLDHLITASDVGELRAFLADPNGSPLSPEARGRCSVIAPVRPCDVLDLVVLRREVEGPELPPRIDPLCPAGQTVFLGEAR